MNDAIQVNKNYENQQINQADPLVIQGGPITRSRAKKVKEAMLGLVKETMAKNTKLHNKLVDMKMGLQEEEPSLINLILALDQT
jgi:hypothetical protein